MGSLMGGWDSNVPDPRTVKLQRNCSLTREEIDTFWKSQMHKEEQHTKEIGTVKSYERSSSVPLSNTKERFLDMVADDENEVSLRNLILKNGWWASTGSAFLNEAPVISEEGNNRHNKFASQFHVADNEASNSKPHHAGNGVST